MATLDLLKQALKEKVNAIATFPKQALTDTEYDAGFDICRGSEWRTYREFIIPQLSQLLTPLIDSREGISVLEIGPGPMSILGYLPSHQRRGIIRYTAYEPNSLFATRLENGLRSTSKTESLLPCLWWQPNIHRLPFGWRENIFTGEKKKERYHVILFCHSMYGMNPKHEFIELALKMLVEPPVGGIVVVFHRDNLHLDGLVCHRTASFPTGTVSVTNEDEVLDQFASFIAGIRLQDEDMDNTIRVDWRRLCRTMGRREEVHPDHILFSAPNVMMSFNHHATTLPELTAQVPLAKENKTIKSRQAHFHHPASVIRPTEIQHVQQCVQWALKHSVSLTVIGGAHSGQCLWPNVVAVDMGAFDRVHILTAEGGEGDSDSDSGPLIVVEAGCKTGDIVSKTTAAGLIVPLGARPSVGAGLWLQGGIGHLARLHGLACDAIFGAVLVSVDSGQVICVGRVPNQHWPSNGVRPENENELLWAMKGAGTNFGIVVSVTFKAYAAPTYSVRNWIVPLSDNLEVQRMLKAFNEVASNLARNLSADAFLYCDNAQLCLGVTVFESSTSTLAIETPTPMSTILGPEDNFKIVDSGALFDSEMYISGMHGGHGGGKTSSFKRCIFLKAIGTKNIAEILVAAIEARPSLLCYFHLLHGGGAIGDVSIDASAFDCRDWDFACVITAVWPRDQDKTETARAATRWVYSLAEDLLPLSSGAYGADLGPDPRDAALAAKAYRLNLPRLASLKHRLDPHNVLAYACPLLKVPIGPKLIILITGECGAGKDYCADIWVSAFTRCNDKGLLARSVSISEATKQEYAAATGADLNRLFQDRGYKEQHRPALTKFFHDQVQQRPRLAEEHFSNVVSGAADVDVLLITGMRDEAPVAAFSHLVPDSKLLEVYIKASEATRQARRGCHVGGDEVENNNGSGNNSVNSGSKMMALDHRPTLIFANDTTGDEAANKFVEDYLLPFIHLDLSRLSHMVRQVSDYPRPGIEFRHVLGVSQQSDGLALCTSLLKTHFTCDWAKVDKIACCEAGGFIFASALAARVNVPLLLIREAGKLPPPTISVTKPSSNISSLRRNDLEGKRIEMERGVVSMGATVVVVDDVLSTGETLCAVVQLLVEVGVNAEDISVMVVAEFPAQRGRSLLRQRGFGRVNVQSLLSFGGA